MNIVFAFKNFEPSEHLKGYAKRRFEKLGRFLHKSENAECSIMMAVDKFRHTVEVQLVGDNLNLSAVETSEDMYATVDMVLDKLEAQIKKHVEKLKEKRRGGKGGSYEHLDLAEEDDARERSIVESNTASPKPMHVDEAALQLEQREDDVFLVFINARNNRVNVIYRKKNGDFGVIDAGQ